MVRNLLSGWLIFQIINIITAFNTTKPYNGPHPAVAPVIALGMPILAIILGLMTGFYVIWMKKKGLHFVYSFLYGRN